MRASQHSATLLMLRSQVALAAAAVLVKHLCFHQDPKALAAAVLLLAPFLAFIYCLARGELSALRRLDWTLTAARGALVAVALAGGYVAIDRLPLAIAIGLSFLTPLFVTLIAMTVLRESVLWRRRGAVALGLVGLLCIVRPWQDALPVDRLGEIAAVAGAMAYALNIALLRRHLARCTTPEVVSANLLGTSLCSAAFALPMLAGPLLRLDLAAPLASELLLLGIVTALGILCQAEAHGRAARSYLAPFAYLQLVWAGLAAALIWREWPDAPAAFGIALIVVAGLYTARRETVRRVHAVPPRADPDLADRRLAS